MSDRNTRIRKGQLGDESVEPIDLEANNGADTGDVPTLGEDGQFHWTALAGGGDMLKSVYDTDDDGIVDKAESVDDGTTGDAHKSTATEVRDAVDKAHASGSDDQTATTVPTDETGVSVQDHIDAVDNPHSVTKAQVGLTNVTDDVQLKENISSYDEKITPADDDYLLLEDSEETGTPIKKVKKSALGGGLVDSVNGQTGDVNLTADDIPTEDSGITTQEALNALEVDQHASHSDDQDASEIPTDETGVSVQDHIDATDNPHSVTKAQVGLTNVQDVDTTDANNINTDETGVTVQEALDLKTTLTDVKADVDIADAISKKHSQNTDTHLGTVDQDIAMGAHKLTGLSVPASNGDSIRATTKITEANLEDAIDKRVSVDNFTIINTASVIKVADRIEENIMLLAFYRCVDQSKSVYNLIDGIIDEYEDETGIDTVASINESYDSSNDLYTNLEYDTYTKLLTHCDGSDGGTTITDETGKTITNTADQYDSYTKLMLHGDGTDGATTVTDSCSSPKTVTNDDNKFDSYTKLCSHFNGTDGDVAYTDPIAGAYTFNGTARLEQDQKKFGATSLWLDGDSDYVTLPDSDSWTFGTGDFTIDAWIRLNSVAGNYGIFGQDAGDGLNYQYLYWGSNKFTYTYHSDSALKVNWTASFTASANTWYHITVVRSGNTWYLFVDGASKALTLEGGSYSADLTDIAGVFIIGSDIPISGGADYFNGYIDELRISKGIARWTSAFTPPVQPYGRVYISTFQKELGTASMLFDGSGSYLTLADSDDWNFGSGDFTIDFWKRYNVCPKNGEYVVGVTRFQVPATKSFGTYENYNGSIYRLLFLYSVNGTTFTTISGTTIPMLVDTWHHIAYVRNGNTLTMYFDGVACGTGDLTGITINDNDLELCVGGDTANNYTNGYIDELRISKGIARWTSAFTPPVQPYGRVYISTAQKEFGTASAVFDGSGSYLTLADSDDWNFGAGDFTIDAWVRFSSLTTGYKAFVEQYEDEDNYIAFYCYYYSVDNTMEIIFLAEDDNVRKAYYHVTLPAGAIATNTWYHLAFVRNSTNFYFFLDGVSKTLTAGTPISTNNLGDMASTLRIGYSEANAVYFNGYIDELRISKGIARWTSNFTPPNLAYHAEDITLISEEFTAESEPANARIVIFEEDVDAITINTDLKALVSIDNGANYDQITLTDEGDWATGKRILSGVVDVSARTGTTIKYKLTSHNGKELKIHGTAVAWT